MRHIFAMNFKIIKKYIKEPGVIIFIIFIFFYFAILFLCFFILESYKTLDWSPYIYGVALGAAITVTAYIILSPIFARWNKQGYWHWNEGLLWILWSIMLHIGIATLLWLNIFFDNSPPMIHEVKVLKKWYAPSWLDFLSSSPDSVQGVKQRPYVRVISWREGETTIDLDVRKSMYDTIWENWTLSVTTQQGFFGWEWIVSVEPI